MSHAKHTPRTNREQARAVGASPGSEGGPELQEAYVVGEPKSSPGARFAFVVWFFGFLFLSILVLWDLIRAVIDTIFKKLA
jgi:hypothetical protein